VWFADSEDARVSEVVEKLSHTSGLDNHVLSQVGILVRELCKSEGLPEPVDDLQKLSTALSNDPTVSTSDSSSSSKSASGSGSSSTNDNGSSEYDMEYEFDDDDDDEDDGNCLNLWFCFAN